MLKITGKRIVCVFLLITIIASMNTYITFANEYEEECSHHYYIVVDSGVVLSHTQKCTNIPCWVTYFCVREQRICQNCFLAYIVNCAICFLYEVHSHPSVHCSWGK